MRDVRDTGGHVSIRQHTSAYVSVLRQHTSAYVSIRQHALLCEALVTGGLETFESVFQPGNQDERLKQKNAVSDSIVYTEYYCYEAFRRCVAWNTTAMRTSAGLKK
jgi:hypothetical protein